MPGTPTWVDMDYQATGLVKARTRFDAVTFPQVIGGLDAVEWLQRHHESDEAANHFRLRGNYLGRVQAVARIRHLYATRRTSTPSTAWTGAPASR